MSYLVTEDGVRLGYDQSGEGPALVIVDAAMQFRAFDPGSRRLLERLAGAGLSVWHHDRRGRGESRAPGPFTLALEIADLRAVIEAAGGKAALLGISSGGAIALAAAAAGLPVSHVIAWEPPLGPEQGADGAEFHAGILSRIAEGDGDAVQRYFMKDMPAAWLEGALVSPAWPVMTAMSATLAPDGEALAWAQSAPLADLLAPIAVPVVALYGEETMPMFSAASERIAQAAPDGEARRIAGRHHGYDLDAMVDVIVDLLRPGAASGQRR